MLHACDAPIRYNIGIAMYTFLQPALDLYTHTFVTVTITMIQLSCGKTKVLCLLSASPSVCAKHLEMEF